MSLINSKLLKLKKEDKKNYCNANLVTNNGVKSTRGVTTRKIKNFDIEKTLMFIL